MLLYVLREAEKRTITWSHADFFSTIQPVLSGTHSRSKLFCHSDILTDPGSRSGEILRQVKSHHPEGEAALSFVPNPFLLYNSDFDANSHGLQEPHILLKGVLRLITSQ